LGLFAFLGLFAGRRPAADLFRLVEGFFAREVFAPCLRDGVALVLARLVAGGFFADLGVFLAAAPGVGGCARAGPLEPGATPTNCALATVTLVAPVDGGSAGVTDTPRFTPPSGPCRVYGVRLTLVPLPATNALTVKRLSPEPNV
jgi:hypothetical protein